jgi:hypothetical protein
MLHQELHASPMWIHTADGAGAITRLGVCSVYVARVPASRVREAVGMWGPSRCFRLNKILRVSGPHARRHHQNHQNLSTLQVAHTTREGCSFQLKNLNYASQTHHVDIFNAWLF